jgi:hypothetical protein
VAEWGDLNGVEALGKLGRPGVSGGGDVGGGVALGGVATREKTGEEASQAQGGDFQKTTCGAACSK